MSTSYYAIRRPFSRVDVVHDEAQRLVQLYIGGSFVGELRCSVEDAACITYILHDEAAKVAHRSNGVASMEHHLPDAMQVISEYGDLTTIGELRRGVAP